MGYLDCVDVFECVVHPKKPLSELGPPNGHYLNKFYQEESLCISLKHFVSNLLNNVDVLECVAYSKKF